VVTIKDIAKLSNVSIGTVDRVIHNRGYVSAEAKRKVEWAIRKLKYTPNIYARQLKLSRRYKFGILMPELQQDANYWGQAAVGMRKAAEELENFKVKIRFFYFDRYSEDSFCKKYTQILKDGMDGFLIAPILVDNYLELIRRIPEKIPYVFFDSDLPNTRRFSFIGQDPFQSGLLAGRLMKMLIVNEGDIAVIRVLPEDYHINLRTEGFQSYFSNNGHRNAIRVYNWHENKDLNNMNTLVNDILNQNGNLKGIFITNALTYLVASTIKSKRMEGKIRIIGYDLVEENVAYLKNSVIDFLISQSPITQGYQGIFLLYRKIVLNHAIEDKIMMPIDIVTKENIDFYKYAPKDSL
jgi:LacI family transcriptional regulator